MYSSVIYIFLIVFVNVINDFFAFPLISLKKPCYQSMAINENNIPSFETKNHDLYRHIHRFLATSITSVSIFFGNGVENGISFHSIAIANDNNNYNNNNNNNPAWNDRNRLAAETWRTVDELFYDRTFNRQDWFKLRQSVVKKNYKSDEEVYQSLQSMLAKLGDKYTRYLTPAQYSALMNSATGELTGVGVQLLAREDGKVIVSNIEEDSPAYTSGIKPNDEFINVDGIDTNGLSPEEVAAIIRGKKDTKASIRILRDGKIIKDFVVIRQPFKLKGVTYSKETINGKSVGIIKIRSFASNTKEDVINALEELYHESLDYIILDLRNNGGGILQSAVDIAALFLKPGKIVTYVVNKDGLLDALQTLPNSISSNNPELPNLKTKLYVFVNSQTASAAEVLTAGLKENDRAMVVGEKTFGKGIIQNLQELQQGGVAVTIARYETPLHNNINKIGILVDIPVTCGEDMDVKTCVSSFLSK